MAQTGPACQTPNSTVEKECLEILLRGKSPVVICPARGLPLRVPPAWRAPLAEGRLLLLSGFAANERRVTAELAAQRNELVAALADDVFIAHATPGGQVAGLARKLADWGVPVTGAAGPRQD